MLLKRKADPGARNSLGETPLQYARTAEMKKRLVGPALD